jgi:hypothetical protein
MSRPLPIFAFATFALVACSSSSSPSPSPSENPGAAEDSGAPGAADGGAHVTAAKGTWGYVYANYFAAGTVGHCGNAGCHAQVRQGFLCGKDANTCYHGLVNAGLIGTSAKTQPLVDPKVTPLSWFNSGGEMPEDAPQANAAAAGDLQAWIASGAKND